MKIIRKTPKFVLSSKTNQFPWKLNKLRFLKKRKWARIKFKYSARWSRNFKGSRAMKFKFFRTYKNKTKKLFKRYFASNLTERQYKKLFRSNSRYKATFKRVLQSEHRLDSLVFRLYMLPDIYIARELIKKNYFLINGKSLALPKFVLGVGDVLSPSNKLAWQFLYNHMLCVLASIKKYFHRIFFKLSFPFVLQKKRYKLREYGKYAEKNLSRVTDRDDLFWRVTTRELYYRYRKVKENTTSKIKPPKRYYFKPVNPLKLKVKEKRLKTYIIKREITDAWTRSFTFYYQLDPFRTFGDKRSFKYRRQFKFLSSAKDYVSPIQLDSILRSYLHNKKRARRDFGKKRRKEKHIWRKQKRLLSRKKKRKSTSKKHAANRLVSRFSKTSWSAQREKRRKAKRLKRYSSFFYRKISELRIIKKQREQKRKTSAKNRTKKKSLQFALALRSAKMAKHKQAVQTKNSLSPILGQKKSNKLKNFIRFKRKTKPPIMPKIFQNQKKILTIKRATHRLKKNQVSRFFKTLKGKFRYKKLGSTTLMNRPRSTLKAVLRKGSKKNYTVTHLKSVKKFSFALFNLFLHQKVKRFKMHVKKKKIKIYTKIKRVKEPFWRKWVPYTPLYFWQNNRATKKRISVFRYLKKFNNRYKQYSYYKHLKNNLWNYKENFGFWQKTNLIYEKKRKKLLTILQKKGIVFIKPKTKVFPFFKQFVSNKFINMTEKKIRTKTGVKKITRIKRKYLRLQGFYRKYKNVKLKIQLANENIYAPIQIKYKKINLPYKNRPISYYFMESCYNSLEFTLVNDVDFLFFPYRSAFDFKMLAFLEKL